MNFEEAFLRINGRKPKDTETKDALALAEVLKRSDLDPMLLLLMADAKAKGEREQFVADMRSIATETIATIREGLPTSPEWAKAAAWAEWFSATMHAEGKWAIKLATRWTIALTAILLACIVFSFWAGYSMGWHGATLHVFDRLH
ncbi:MAG: hypothetical protein HKL92_10190 [Candidatus Eremiobacteraeota bacterium]|nr:hypothetical protein [Candidatus Eremiobacteraeota bacterium]